MLLDADAGLVYFSTLPESERLYILDIASGAFTFHRLREGGRKFIPVEIALAEDNNLFTLLFDPLHELEENGPAEDGLWMGVFNPEGDPVTAAIPLLAPVRIEYDPVRRHVFLATESNLATFEFNPLNSALTFVQGTDIAVGSGCTDFSISPDGNRLAYSCPAGNERTPSTAIVDMDPLEVLQHRREVDSGKCAGQRRVRPVRGGVDRHRWHQALFLRCEHPSAAQQLLTRALRR